MYLRHVGRDGCVDVDLQTYSIGPQLAKRAVLLQVLAQSRQFAVWHEDQVVKRLPIKGLVGQEMTLDDYVQYIQQEALAAPRRSPTRSSRKVRQPSRMASKEPDLFLLCKLFQALVSYLCKCGKNVVSMPGTEEEKPEQIC